MNRFAIHLLLLIAAVLSPAAVAYETDQFSGRLNDIADSTAALDERGAVIDADRVPVHADAEGLEDGRTLLYVSNPNEEPLEILGCEEGEHAEEHGGQTRERRDGARQVRGPRDVDAHAGGRDRLLGALQRLPRRPAGVAGEHPQRGDGVRHQLGRGVEVDYAHLVRELAHADHRPRARADEGQRRVCRHRPAVEYLARLRSQGGPAGQDVGDRKIGRSVEHQPQGTLLRVLQHQHHGAIEVGVAEQRRRHQQLTGRAHRSILAAAASGRAGSGK